jgi:hypothetical protein
VVELDRNIILLSALIRHALVGPRGARPLGLDKILRIAPTLAPLIVVWLLSLPCRVSIECRSQLAQLLSDILTLVSCLGFEISVRVNSDKPGGGDRKVSLSARSLS